MLDRTDLLAGAAATTCHLAAWIALHLPGPPTPPAPDAEAAPSATAIPVPAERPTAALILPPGAAAAEHPGDTGDEPPLPPLDPPPFNPPQLMHPDGPEAPSTTDGDHPDAPEPDAPALPPAPATATALEGRRAASAERAQAVDRERRQIAEARHFFEGRLRATYHRLWRHRWRDRIRNRDLVLLLSIDARQRVRQVTFLRGTGVDELDTRIRLYLEQRSAEGAAWGLPPLPNEGLARYTFRVHLPD